MKIPVFPVARDAYDSAVHFAVTHPILIAASILCSLPFERWLAASSSQGAMEGDAGTGVWIATLLASLASGLVWAPASVLLIREIASGATLPSLQAEQAGAIARYGLLVGLTSGVGSVVTMIPVDSLSSAAVATAAVAIATMVVLRTTLAFTAIALGQSDYGFLRSWRATSGAATRLLAIVLAAALPALLVGAILVFLIFSGANGGAPGLAALSLTAALVQACIQLCLAAAGAHVYTLLGAGQT